MYDEHGKQEIGRDGKPIPRLNVPTPCSSCPRGSPEREAETTLSEKNWKAYTWFLQVRATHGRCIYGRRQTDELSNYLLTICDSVVRDHELSTMLQVAELSQVRAMQNFIGR